ncbi:PREDICTED: protein spt2-like [Tarenaya hassleriana]|uniref:protein spt2-like n=1 Tax=Tarenaya hassleriana TaxID=28532 RepID=UPI00053CA927|nr:PREDICTED: protein spt2-like [Tarenaya hassleriana]
MMREYEDDLDENVGYEEYDEYEEYDGEGREEEGAEYEEAEERQPTKEELEYLELRQRLKESIRKKMKREGGNALSSQEKKSRLPYNDFGSFFGPSRPLISSRVIQESKSLLENEQLASRLLKPSQATKRPVAVGSSASKNGSYDKRPKVVNEVKKKVEKLKDTRDYSFLFSDDVDLPVSRKDPPSQNRPIPSSEARSSQSSAKPKYPSGTNGRTAPSAREERRPHSRADAPGSQMHTRPTSSSGQTHTRPAPSGSQIHARPAPSGSKMRSRPSSSGFSTNGQSPSREGLATNDQTHKSASRSSQPSSKLSSQRPVSARRPDSVPMDQRRQLGNNNGVGLGRPAGTAKQLPSKTPISGTTSRVQSAQRPSSSRPLPSDHRRSIEQRKVSNEPIRSQVIHKQSIPPAKNQISKPPKRAPAREIVEDRRPKKKLKMSEDDKALGLIRKMFRTDRFAGRDGDDDDSDMEANWEDIMREEKRSAMIAQKEDEEQLRLIEEEERRERMRKMAKKRRLSH